MVSTCPTRAPLPCTFRSQVLSFAVIFSPCELAFHSSPYGVFKSIKTCLGKVFKLNASTKILEYSAKAHQNVRFTCIQIGFVTAVWIKIGCFWCIASQTSLSTPEHIDENVARRMTECPCQKWISKVLIWFEFSHDVRLWRAFVFFFLWTHEVDKEACLVAHNAKRAFHQNTNPLTWSDTLAQLAKAWADHLVEQTEKRLEHDPSNKDVEGKNLIYSFSPTDVYSCAEAVEAWWVVSKSK